MWLLEYLRNDPVMALPVLAAFLAMFTLVYFVAISVAYVVLAGPIYIVGAWRRGEPLFATRPAAASVFLVTNDPALAASVRRSARHAQVDQFGDDALTIAHGFMNRPAEAIPHNNGPASYVSPTEHWVWDRA